MSNNPVFIIGEGKRVIVHPEDMSCKMQLDKKVYSTNCENGFVTDKPIGPYIGVWKRYVYVDEETYWEIEL